MEPGAGRGGGLDRGDGGAWPVRERGSGAGREPSNAFSSYVSSLSLCNGHSASAIASAPSNTFDVFAPIDTLPMEVDLKGPSSGGGRVSLDSVHVPVSVDSSCVAAVDSSAPPVEGGGHACGFIEASR